MGSNYIPFSEFIFYVNSIFRKHYYDHKWFYYAD